MYKTLISTSQLLDILGKENLVVIDCRFSLTDTEYGEHAHLESHIPNAVYAHLDKDLSGEIIQGTTGRHPFPKVEDLVRTLSNWGVDNRSQVVIYDQSHGGIAARLWCLMKWLGHESVAVLDGGWARWEALGLPKESGRVEHSLSTFEPKPIKEMLVDVVFMEEHLNDSEYIYIDARAAERYRGEKEPIDPIAGHIPGAVSLPFLGNLGDDGLFLPKNELAKRFLNILRKTDKARPILYCGSGVTACHNLLAFHHLGLYGAKLYPGSWSEWIVDKERSIGIVVR